MTEQPSAAQAGAAIPIQPAYIRLPRPGARDSYTGLSRTALFGLLKSGKVKSVSLRQDGCKRGIRLIDAASLIGAIKTGGTA